ncbi:MAG: hypothetical protein IT486_03100 [Gammaproteobacteria bacterium]|nr:hypothetical protein [Gammaproteobacteria bacterium]
MAFRCQLMRMAWTGTLLTVSVFLLAAAGSSHAALLIYNSNTPAGNAAARSQWLSAIGIASPPYVVDFESGFTSGQNVSGVTGLFPAGLVLGSSNGSAIIASGSGSIDGSNPVGAFALSHTASAILTLDLGFFPVDYLAFQDIDAGNTSITVTYVGGGTDMLDPLDLTGSGSDSAEFVGLFRNDMPRITRVDLTTTGGTLWGVDSVEYGPAVPLPGALWLAVTAFLGTGARHMRWRREIPNRP